MYYILNSRSCRWPLRLDPRCAYAWCIPEGVLSGQGVCPPPPLLHSTKLLSKQVCRKLTDVTSCVSTLVIIRVIYVCLCLTVFLPVCWGWKGMFLMAGDVGLYGHFLLISLSVSPETFVPPSLPSTQLPALLSLQILQVVIQTFVSFSPLLSNKRGLSSNTMLIHPMLICSPILFISSLLSHCSWPLLCYWNGHQDYQWHVKFCDSLYCPHRISFLWSPCLYLIIYSSVIYWILNGLSFFCIFACLLPGNITPSSQPQN